MYYSLNIWVIVPTRIKWVGRTARKHDITREGINV